MKKNTPYSFWFTILFFTGGTFALWANFFHPSSLMIDTSRTVAFQSVQKTAVPIIPKSVSTDTQRVQPVASKNVQIQAQPAPVAVPTSARATKTS